jgi:fido (protein-threonine AMPylation protein)
MESGSRAGIPAEERVATMSRRPAGRYTSLRMFQRLRIRKAHALFLDSCRSMKEDRAYWDQASGLTRWFLQTVLPIPLLGLHNDGKLLLEDLEWLEENSRKVPLTEEVIQHYHRTIFRKAASTGGEYRRDKIIIVGSTIPRPPPEKVPALMKQLNLKLSTEQNTFDAMRPLDASALFKLAMDIHQRIGLIHPFTDGNGRVARLAMNHILRRYSLGYVILPPLSEARSLMDALQDAHRGHLEPLVEFAMNCVYLV